MIARDASSRRPLQWMAIVLSMISVALPARTDETQARRSRAGVRVFRTLLSADLNLERKTVDSGKLLMVFYYSSNRREAEELAGAFTTSSGSGTGEIRGFPVAIETTSDPTFSRYRGRPPAGIFIAEAPDPVRLMEIIRFGIENHVVVYSPFEGHVERGVLGGLAIEAQVRPYVNRATLDASGIELKEFFLKVTKVYP